MWHALEEREHRAVAFDLYERAGGTYWHRVTWGPYFIVLLVPFVFYEVVRVLADEGVLRDRRAIHRGFRDLFSKRSALAGIRPYMREYFRRGFHPSQDDQSTLEAGWRTELGLAA